MTVDDCRIILKVHLKAKESIGAIGPAFALLEALTAIDYQLTEEKNNQALIRRDYDRDGIL